MSDINDDLWFINFSSQRQLAELAGEIDMLLCHEKDTILRKILRKKENIEAEE